MPPKTRKGTGVSHGKAERKTASSSISKQIHEEGKYEEEEELKTKKKSSSLNSAIASNMTPLQNTQFEFIKGVFNFLMDNFTSEKFIVTLLIGFVINVMYAKFNDEFENDIMTVGFCWLGALTSYVVSYITQQRALTKAVLEGKIDADSPLATARAPSFERLYATTLPVMICFILRKDLLVMNLALTYLLLELPSAVKLFISVTVMYNFQEGDNFLDCTFIPTFHWVVETTIDSYTGQSLTAVEKYSFATMLVNLMYAAPDNGDQILVILKYLVYWFGGLIYVSTPVYGFYKKLSNKQLQTALLVLLYGGFSSIFYFGVVYSLTPILGEHPITWLKDFVLVSDLRFNIFKIWLVLFATLVPLFVKIASHWELQSKRKIWHFIIFGMLLYPIIVDPQLATLALVGLSGIFIVVEVLRITQLPPFGSALSSLLKPFQDERDNQGPVVISYLFLICGIALPVFFNNSVAGLVCLGVGDSAASIIGKRIGQVPWFDSKKTMEGTMAFIFTSTLAMYLYKYLGGVDYSWNTIFMSCVFTAILEGLSELNDNLLAPLFMFLMLEVLHYNK